MISLINLRLWSYEFSARTGLSWMSEDTSVVGIMSGIFLYSNFETAMQEFRDIRTPPSAEKNKKWCVPKSHSSAVNTTAGMGMNFLTGFTENHSLRMIRKRFPGLFCWYISFSYKKPRFFFLSRSILNVWQLIDDVSVVISHYNTCLCRCISPSLDSKGDILCNSVSV